MQNTHLEHPEDSILTGDLSVLDWFSAQDSFISTKMDGAPAIVWGRNPANGMFFVGTKAVFNKVKIRIAHSHDEIETFYQGKVARILHACFDCLPYRPNTITYIFPEIISQDVIIAPHTVYGGADDLRHVTASPLMYEMSSNDRVMFVQPESVLNPFREDLEDVCKFAKQMSTLCEFVNKNKATKIKKAINECIREGEPVDENRIAEKTDCDINLIRLWKLVESIKTDMFLFIDERDEIGCMIGDEPVCHEGYVITNDYGTFKVVDREEFSRANFIMEKTWS